MDKRLELNPDMAMSDRHLAERTAAAWIAKRDTGPWSEADAAALAAWLEESAGHRVAYYRLNSAWQETGRLKALMVQSPSSRTPRSLLRGARSLHFAIAATVLLAIGALLSSGGRFHRNDYSTVVGGLQSVPMPDGSKITLNTDSEIHVTLTDTERRVELKHGEAFFEVAKDPQRPFIVSTAGQRVVAVGTAFSVRRDGNDLRVIVTEGKVRVEIPGKNPALLDVLPAGSVLRAESNAVLVQTKRSAEIEQHLSWRHGLLTFHNTPLAVAVAEFNRYNTRKIVIEDPAIAALEIGGIVRSTNLDPFVRLLQDGFPIRATVKEDRIILTSR